VIVAHDGARWLPRLLTALETGATVPDELVAVDTGSTDATGDLLRSSFGDRAVIDAPRDTGFGDAVRTALASVAGPPDPHEKWVRLLP
jgi:glycosyltransferase involved in cell wall biosynthesis